MDPKNGWTHPLGKILRKKSQTFFFLDLKRKQSSYVTIVNSSSCRSSSSYNSVPRTNYWTPQLVTDDGKEAENRPPPYKFKQAPYEWMHPSGK